jgi:hypothetical protein
VLIVKILRYIPKKTLVGLQLVHRQWYEKRIPKMIKTIYTKEGKAGRDKKRVQLLLSVPPPNATKKEALMWTLMKPLTIKLFDKFLKRVNPEEQLFDLKNSSYQEWNDEYM